MDRDIAKLSDRDFDVVVIGGGIFGACAAWDACLRGYSVALIEKDDFCSGVSANSFKVVHGGIRYIQHGDIIRLRASCRERSALLRVAPHLVKPLPILIPTYGHGKSGKAFLGAGMYLYDLLTLDRNRNTRDPSRAIPWSRLLGRDEVLGEFPGLQQQGLTGGAIFNDGQIYNPTRLVLSFVKSAMDRGACIANYVEATDILTADGAAVGVRAHDRINDESFNIRAKVVLNASGPWAERLLEHADVVDHGPEITYSRDTCFLVNRRFSSDCAIAIQGQTHDPDALLSRPARHLFLVPWRNYTLVGVWHGVRTAEPDRITVEVGEIQAYLDEINWACPSLGLTLADVTMWNAGLVPFGENDPDQKHLSYGKRSHIIDHSVSDGMDNLVTLIGIRYTMARGDAEKAMDLVTSKLGRDQISPPTDIEPVSGGDIDDFDGLLRRVIDTHGKHCDRAVLTALVHNYGTRYEDVLRYDEAGPDASTVMGDTTTLKAEVHYALENEMVSRLTDLVFRRTDLATGGHPGDDVLRECAQIMAREKDWSEDRINHEILEVNARFPHF